ncbi:winged helix-turn-helix domain-containing protein [Sphingomonas floccifaciens]|uniref:Winged helix-turn-helix domain-containing protein n=1 Tax=Sphingomonas floccifaciens TaxID=1844115 RepID=A0ABW4N9S1_9SPHN
MFHDHAPFATLHPDIARRPLVKRGAVSMTLDPVEFRWNGHRVALSRVEATLLAALMRRSRLNWDMTAGVLADAGSCPDSRDVLIHRIRRKFADVGAADPIETVRGWGIRFRTEADRSGSTAFWIGATEDETVLA